MSEEHEEFIKEVIKCNATLKMFLCDKFSTDVVASSFISLLLELYNEFPEKLIEIIQEIISMRKDEK